MSKYFKVYCEKCGAVDQYIVVLFPSQRGVPYYLLKCTRCDYLFDYDQDLI